MIEQDLFQNPDGGSMPTSPLQLYIRPISHLTAGVIYKKWHYLGENGFLASFNYGVYFNDICLGAISYGIPNARNIKSIYDEKTQGYYMELTRLALSDKCPKNSESRVISITLKMLKKTKPELKGVITYADTQQNHTGIIYKASNFKYIGLTSQKTDLFVNGKKYGKQKGIKYSQISGKWIKRSRKHLYLKQFEI